MAAVTEYTAVHTPPGPPPVKGVFNTMRAMQAFAADAMGVMGRWKATYGDVVDLQIGAMRQYILSNPDDIHQVLVEKAASFNKDQTYKDTRRGLGRFLGNGLLISDGEFWKRQRRLAAPALHARRIASYADIMVRHSDRLMQSWHDGQRMDIAHQMKNLTMTIVAEALFHSDVSGETARVSDAMEAIQTVSNGFSIVPPWVPTPTELQARRGKRILDEIIYRMIAERRATGEDKGDLLSMLMLARDDDGGQMSDQQVRDEAVTLFLAGHETTANLMSWVWYLLSQHPEVVRKLQAELDQVLAGRLPALDDLKQLPYTEMIVKETLRLYPPAWSVGREAIENVQIGDYVFPKGSDVAVMIYFVHHDPRWYPDPERFEPDRFSPENEAQIPRYAYLPFGGGPRVCIGNMFALMETQLVLATIASRYDFELAPGYQVNMHPRITLSVRGGLPVIVRARQPVANPVVAELSAA